MITSSMQKWLLNIGMMKTFEKKIDFLLYYINKLLFLGG